MIMPMPILSSKVAVLGLLLVSVGACGTTAPVAAVATPAAAAQTPDPVTKPVDVFDSQPQFTATATAKASLVGSLVTVAPDRVVSDLDALSKRLQLPMLLGHELLSTLLGMGGDTIHLRELWDRLDPAAPIAVVWVLPPHRGFCAAVTLRDNAAAKRVLHDLGPVGQQQNGISEHVSASGDKLWGGIKGRTLFVSGSAETLLLAGGLAEAAQVTPPKGQMVLTVMSQALAAASGKTPDALVAHMASVMAGETQAGQGKATPAVQRMIAGMTEVVAKLLLDSTAVHLIFDMGPSQGVLIQAELVPASGADLAARTARRTPYAFDPRLPVQNDETAVFSTGDWSVWMPMLAKVFESSGPAGHGVWKDTSKMVEMTAGWSCVADSTDAGLSTLCSAALKPNTSGKTALDATVAMMTSQHAWEAELDGRKAGALKVKRGRDAVEIEKKIESKDPTARALAKAMAGGDVLKYALSVKDGRLLMTMGRDAKKALSRYGAASSMANAPLLAATLARTKGDEMMASVDVVSFVLRLVGQGKDLPGKEMAMMAGAMPGVSEMTAPFVFAVRGGTSLVAEFAIPLGSLDSVAKVVRGIVGPAGGAPSK